ncbi:helix-turn-helix transcriptional regulator [Streptomyces longispororuber]|uniref:helix-turn-helix transcriptional regulator n=1 Tax=Streptomyces longispororuber TaxID=68230 RepID=UPI0033C4CF3D
MDFRAELASFLKSRRARLRPEDLGVRPFGGRRRVPGLRREELAELAGVSMDYYTRLEQGRTQNVSDGVLDAVARVLRLDATERAHLGNLVRALRHSSGPGARPGPDPRPVREGVRVLLRALDGVPAYVLGPRLDVLAANPLARALFGDLDAGPADRRNVAWRIFLDPGARELYADWEEAARDTVVALRLDLGRHACDDRLCGLLGELSVRSEDFRRLWAEHQVRETTHGTLRLRHPRAGTLLLHREELQVAGAPDQTLVTYAADPGSPTADALTLLTMTHTDRTAASPSGV